MLRVLKCEPIDFTKEEIEALVNERPKMKKFDHKVFNFCNLLYCNMFNYYSHLFGLFYLNFGTLCFGRETWN